MHIPVKKLTLMAILTASALIIFIIEAQIPLPVPIPGVKLGLANAVTLFALFYGKRKAMGSGCVSSADNLATETTAKAPGTNNADTPGIPAAEVNAKAPGSNDADTPVIPAAETNAKVFGSNDSDIPGIPAADALTNANVFAILLCRIILGAIFTGRPVAFIYSIAGGLLSFAAQALMKRVVTTKQIWVCGAIGAVFHNIGQILAAVIITGTPAVAAYLPMLVIAGVFTGVITGLIAQFTLTRIRL